MELDLEAVVRVAAYHRLDYDQVVVRYPPQQSATAPPSIVQPFSSSPTSSLGVLRHLPAEIINEICLQMDIATCIRFRQACRLARITVHGLMEYRDVTNYALDGLRATLLTGAANHLTLSDLHQPLCTMACATCGDFGRLLFLPAAKRCCYNCLEFSTDFTVVSLTALANLTGVTQRKLRRLVPVVKTTPGIYTLLQRHCHRRLNLVSSNLASKILLRRGIWFDATISTPGWNHTRTSLRCMVSTAFPYLDRAKGETQDGVSCKGCQIHLEEQIHDGFLKNGEALYARRDLVYSNDGFVAHFKTCQEAQRLWEASCGGTEDFSEPEFTRRGGLVGDLDSDYSEYDHSDDDETQ